MKTKKLTSKSFYLPYLRVIAGLAFILLLSSQGFGQITGVYPEGPSTIGRNGFQMSAIYSTIIPSEELWLDGQLSRIGFGGGYGANEHIDLKFSYTRWMDGSPDYHLNAFQFAAKFSSKNNRIAFYLPLSLIYSNEEDSYGEDNTEMIWAVAPRLICSIVSVRGFDLSINPYLEILGMEDFGMGFTAGTNLCMGFGIIPDMLTFRIEGGIDLMTALNGFPIASAGFGLYFTIGRGQPESLR